VFRRNIDSDLLSLAGSSAPSTNGGWLALYGRDHATYPGMVSVTFGGNDTVGSFIIQHRSASSFSPVLSLSKDGVLRLWKYGAGVLVSDAYGNITSTTIDSGDISDITEAAQDAVGAALVDSSSIDFTYTDASNQISAVVLPAGVNHSVLGSLNTANYWHLTQANHTDLTDAGDSALHYHATDRVRANHTGTQAWNTLAGTPTTLVGYGITDAQPLDGDLTAIAALTTTGYVRRTATNTWDTRSNSQVLSDIGGASAAHTHALDDLSDVYVATPNLGDVLCYYCGGLWGSLKLPHSYLAEIGANDHHNQSHVLATNVGLGADHTISGATAGHVLRASGATTANFEQLLHSDLGSLNTTSYWHLTQANHTDLTDAGNSALHYHATDRARANHTGTQAWSTLTGTPTTLAGYGITDYAEAAQDAVGTALVDSSSIDFTYTDISNQISAVVLPAGVDHSALGSLNSTSYWHLTQANHTDLTDAGDSALHYHATDRARANHTGTQAWSTLTGTPTTLAGYGITDAITGSGTSGRIPKLTASQTIANSLLNDDGTHVFLGLNTGVTPTGKLHVGGGFCAGTAVGDEYLQLGHDGGNGYVDVVGDGAFLIKHEGVNKAAFWDDGSLSINSATQPTDKLYVNGTAKIGTINARATAATVFLTHTSGVIESRTASQLLSDIGAAATGHTHGSLIGTRVTAGAGGTSGSPTVVNVAGKTIVELTPTGGGQYYELAGGTDCQIIFVRFVNSNDPIYFTNCTMYGTASYGRGFTLVYNASDAWWYGHGNSDF